MKLYCERVMETIFYIYRPSHMTYKGNMTSSLEVTMACYVWIKKKGDRFFFFTSHQIEKYNPQTNKLKHIPKKSCSTRFNEN